MSTLSFTTVSLMGAPFGEVNPMPDLKNVSYIHATFEATERVSPEDRKYFGVGTIGTLLPYLSLDNYGRKREMREYKAAILENEYLRATFLTEVGGRLWSLIHKPTGRELLYKNDIVQPCNLGLRNAWVAGGIEWNFGIKGHTPFTCDPLFAAQSRNEDGDPVLSLYEYERVRGVVFGINAYLKDEFLYIRTTVENMSDEPTYAYWWSNIAVPEKNVRVYTDAEDMFTCLYGNNKYTIDKIPAPVFDGQDLSYPERAAYAGDLFYVTNDERRKWIAALDDGFGLLQYSTPELKGRKLFFWGQGQGGRNWNRFLSESNRPYVEIQAGLLRTQMEHIPMPARTEWSWTECYTALDMNAEKVNGDWREACSTIAGYVEALPDPALAEIPLDAKKSIVSYGSGWGAIEDRNISSHYDFPADSMSDVEKEWQTLLQGGDLLPKAADYFPKGYYISPKALELLELSAKRNAGRHWYTFFHIGINKYALGDVEGAQSAWKIASENCESPLVYRNLSMLCKNELSDLKGAVYYMERAIACMSKDVRGLWVDCARVMTDCREFGRWIELFESLPSELKDDGRLRFYLAVAYMKTGNIDAAKSIINKDFSMSDIKEGELSVSALWAELYGGLDSLPSHLDFRMH